MVEGKLGLDLNHSLVNLITNGVIILIDGGTCTTHKVVRRLSGVKGLATRRFD